MHLNVHKLYNHLSICLADVAQHCNANTRFGVKLADNNAMKVFLINVCVTQYLFVKRVIQKKVGELALSAYALESMSYYVAGLLDEDPQRDVEIEGAMVKVS